MSQDATLDTTTYEVIRQRLAAQGQELTKHITDLNHQRQELFGDSSTELLTTARVATEHSCVPRDLIRLASGKLLLGYEVFLGLKKTTAISDVFAEIALTGEHQQDLEPTALEILNDDRFAKDFQDLFTYFKDARLDQLRRTDTHVLAVFRVGSRDSDIKVLRWALTGSGMDEVTYVDNRGDRDHTFPDPHDFEWVETTREMHEHGKHPHINILDTVFVECTEGDLTIKVENNTATGAGVLAEPVEDHSQGLDDADIYFANCEGIILLKMKPYREKEFRYFIFNKLTKEAVRCDDIASACQVLPDGHGLIFPNGFYLSDGTLKVFPVDAAEMNYVRRRRAPNGEDLAYIYHHRGEGRYHILRYNMITRQADQPLVCHGYSFFDNGRLVLFRGDQEPARIHAMQIWQTPFCSDAHYASLDRGSDHKLADIGNRDLVRAISDLSQISRHIANQQPSAAIYSDLIRTLDAVIDSHHWLGDPSVGNMHDTLSTIRGTAGQVIDEFEKVEQLRGQAEQQLRQQQTAYEELERSLAIAGEHDVDALVSGLDSLRRLQGRVAGLRDVRYMNVDDVNSLAETVQKRFDQRAERTIEHLLAGDALSATREAIASGEAAVEAATGTSQLTPISDQSAEIGIRLDLLLDITGSLEVGDPQARTQLLEDIGGIYSDYNRLGALIENRQRELSSTEGRAQFQVEFQLLGQAVTSSMGRCDSVAACDEHQARLLAQLEELEGRYLDQQAFTEALGEKRIEIVEAFETRRQGLLEEQQRRANSLGRSAERLLKTIEHRASNMEDAEALDTYLATDPLVQKLHHLRDELRELGDTVQADDIDAKLKAIQSNSRRQLRDVADLFDGDTVSLGQHAFSRNSQELSLTMLPHDDGEMAWHLTGTDYFSTVDDESFQQTQAYWQRETVAENETVYRAEYLAWLMYAAHEEGGTLDTLRQNLLVPEDAQALTRAAAEERLDHHYQRGLHDHDAAKILTSLVELTDSAGLSRYAAPARCFAIAWWQHLVEQDPHTASALHRRCRSLAKLEQTFTSSAGRLKMVQEIQRTMEEADLATTSDHELLAQASMYAFAELRHQEEVHWLFSGAAADVLQHSQEDLTRRGLLASINTDLAALSAAEAEHLALAWLQGSAIDTPDDVLMEAAQGWTLSVRHQTTSRRIEHARTQTTVSGLLGNHSRVQQRNLSLRVDEFFSRLEHFHQHDVAGYTTYRALRHELLQHEQQRLGLDAFTPRVLGNFVRNRLIDEVYLPLIGDNFAKQIGSVGVNKRTDLQGLLLLISPPGYGKTTLMEYIASILGLVFVKINGPALGHEITSVDPAATQVGTARQELEKLNLAFEMGNNVLIYLDDIQHCNPEFLQKFISLCDGQRRIEGVWRGQTKTYDFRGKKVAVVMAGTPTPKVGISFVFQICWLTVLTPTTLEIFLAAHNAHLKILILKIVSRQIRYLLRWQVAV